MPMGAKIVGFADDEGVVVVVGKLVVEVTLSANQAVGTIRHWLSLMGLELAGQKTEVVLVTSRKVRETVTLNVGDCSIQSQPTLRYLGVQLTPISDSRST